MKLNVSLNIREHICSNEYCIIDAATDTNEYHTSFSFFVAFLFEHIEESNREEFINRVVGNYIDSEITRKIGKQEVEYTVVNMDQSIKEFKKIWAKNS